MNWNKLRLRNVQKVFKSNTNCMFKAAIKEPDLSFQKLQKTSFSFLVSNIYKKWLILKIYRLSGVFTTVLNIYDVFSCKNINGFYQLIVFAKYSTIYVCQSRKYLAKIFNGFYQLIISAKTFHHIRLSES